MTQQPSPQPLPPPDIRGRRLDHPASAPFRAELMALDPAKPVNMLVPGNDPEAANFAETIRHFLVSNGRTATVRSVTFEPPFRGMTLHDGEAEVQLAIGHR